ncbi:hypothetical protein PAEVO_17280 [Paenibacillus sp. GM2FR]|nr:hypothetical protein PAEVO_17280 [Paenibacillus sp. GM2FR]
MSGYIVVLEAGDNLRDLSYVGLKPERGGLVGSYPEYVESLDLGDCQKAYKVVLLYDTYLLCSLYLMPGMPESLGLVFVIMPRTCTMS